MPRVIRREDERGWFLATAALIVAGLIVGVVVQRSLIPESRDGSLAFGSPSPGAPALTARGVRLGSLKLGPSAQLPRGVSVIVAIGRSPVVRVSGPDGQPVAPGVWLLRDGKFTDLLSGPAESMEFGAQSSPDGMDIVVSYSSMSIDDRNVMSSFLRSHDGGTTWDSFGTFHALPYLVRFGTRAIVVPEPAASEKVPAQLWLLPDGVQISQDSPRIASETPWRMVGGQLRTEIPWPGDYASSCKLADGNFAVLGLDPVAPAFMRSLGVIDFSGNLKWGFAGELASLVGQLPNGMLVGTAPFTDASGTQLADHILNSAILPVLIEQKTGVVHRLNVPPLRGTTDYYFLAVRAN